MLHQDDVILAERIVQLAILGIQVYLTTLRVVVINLHHASEDAVVIFAKELRDYHLIYLERTTDNEIVEFSSPSVLQLPCNILSRCILDSPPFSTSKSGNIILACQVAIKCGIALDMQRCHGRNRPGDDFIDAESVFPCLCILDCNRKTFLLTFVEVRRRKLVGCYAAGFYGA